MFALAMEARQRDAGVVGSTSNILDFIAAKLDQALAKPFAERVQVRNPKDNRCQIGSKLLRQILHSISHC